MFLIRNYYAFSDIRLFNPITTTLKKQDTSILLPDDHQKYTKGFFATVAGKQFVLFRQKDLYLTIDAQFYLFKGLCISTNDVHIQYSGYEINKTRQMTIQKDKKIVFQSNYTDLMTTYDNDPTPFIEEEDFDFGLFLENLSNNPEQQQRLFATK
jgi:hypothetical protein